MLSLLFHPFRVLLLCHEVFSPGPARRWCSFLCGEIKCPLLISFNGKTYDEGLKILIYDRGTENSSEISAIFLSRREIVSPPAPESSPRYLVTMPNENKFHSGHFGRVCCLFKQINCLLNRRAAFKPPNRVASNYWLISCVCYNYASSSAIRGSSSLKQLIKSQSIIWRDGPTQLLPSSSSSFT